MILVEDSCRVRITTLFHTHSMKRHLFFYCPLFGAIIGDLSERSIKYFSLISQNLQRFLLSLFSSVSQKKQR